MQNTITDERSESSVFRCAFFAIKVGTALMEGAFHPESGVLRLKEYGAIQLYIGVFAFLRNTTGHQFLNDTYPHSDTLSFVL